MRQGFRAEVQALRALAVVLVVLFHLWPGDVTGGFVGVDVFFVISGYLITSHLWKELAGSGRVRLLSFYTRRMRRLLPAAFLVLAVALAGVVAFVPRADWATMLRDIWTSAVYSVNWVLAGSSVDYFAAEDAVSPVQHYWSLSVEEQFYLVWPLLLIAAWAARRRWVLYCVLGVIFTASMIYSVIGAHNFQSFAYFSTFSHAWEFAAGGFLALLPPKWQLKDGRWATVLSWVGFLAIIVAAMRFTGATLFPGWVALLPVGGALLVIVAGTPRSSWSPSAVVSWAPVQFLGDVSYSLYLWHWVLIILAPYVLGVDYLTGVQKLILLAACVALAWLTKAFVEDPARSSSFLQARAFNTLGSGIVATGLVVALAVIPMFIAKTESTRNSSHVIDAVEKALDEHGDSCVGAMATGHPLECADLHVVEPNYLVTSDAANPTEWAAELANERPYFAARTESVDGVKITRYGKKTAQVRIAIVGDSHAAHHIPAMLLLGERYGWEISVYVRGGCLPAADVYGGDSGERDKGCPEWKKSAFTQVAEGDFDLVVTSGATSNFTRFRDNATVAKIADGFNENWNRWLGSGARVLVISEVPHFSQSVPTCVARSASAEDPCATPKKKVLWDNDPLTTATSRVDSANFEHIDIVPTMCDEDTCHPVVGGIVTHRDSGHLSMSFSMTLAPLLDRSIEALFAR